jgi:hypothetical protein
MVDAIIRPSSQHHHKSSSKQTRQQQRMLALHQAGAPEKVGAGQRQAVLQDEGVGLHAAVPDNERVAQLEEEEVEQQQFRPEMECYTCFAGRLRLHSARWQSVPPQCS